MENTLNENNRKIMLEVAFLDYCRFSNISDADIAVLYERIEQIKKDFENNNDNALEPMLKYDLENINSKEDLKKRINEQKAKMALVIMNAAEVTAGENAQIFVKKYLKDLGFLKDADVLTEAMFEKKLDETYDGKATKADRLANLLSDKQNTLKKNLDDHYKKYVQDGQKHSTVEKFVDTIKDYTLNRKRVTKFKFFIRDGDELFRKALRAIFEKRKNPDIKSSEDGVKAAFLKVYGAMMQIGKDVLEKKNPELGIMMFKKHMRDYYKDNAASEIIQALGLKSMEECDEKLIEKSKNIYIKTVAAIFSKKKEYDLEHKIYNTNYGSYFENAINQGYLNGLKLGEDRVKALGLVEDTGPDARLSKAQEKELGDALWGDMRGNQHVSVHHKIPIGASKDIIINLFGRLEGKDLLLKADSLIHTLGNLELVVGREKHQSLEPRGEVILQAEPSHAIFEARLNPDFMKEICRDTRIPEYIRTELQKYQNQTDIKETMNFSESPVIAQKRAELSASAQKVSIIDKTIQYTN